MAEPMALEIRGAGLDGLWPPARDCYSPPKADSAANKVEVKTKLAASVEAKNKAASVTSFFFEPLARVEGKEASAGFIEPAASVEGKTKAASATSFFIEPAARVFDLNLRRRFDLNLRRRNAHPNRKPAVVEVKIEKVEEDCIEFLRKNPMQRPPTHPPDFFKRYPALVESCRVTDAGINKLVDLQEHILEQYNTKGYAMVLAEYLDNGRKRMSRLPEEEETA